MKYFGKHYWWIIPAFIFAFGFAGVSYGQIHSNSMEPTFKVDEDWLVTNPFERMQIGDVIEFKCFTEECNQGDHNEFVNHRLVKIEENGCMHILGDNQPSAWDTNDYGCLMPDQIKIYGVVHKFPLPF